MSARGLTFGSVAERYERFRPGYPDELVDLVLAGGKVATAVEVGAGTGKATRLFAGRGVEVTAVEPDPAMRAVLERCTAGLPVTVVGCTLEDLPPQPPVDLLHAAAAWHWTEPTTRWTKAAGLLREGGIFASFGSPVDLVDAELSAEVDRLRYEVTERDPELDTADDGMRWPGTELRETPLFADVRQDHIAVLHAAPADDLVGLLSTVSAYVLLPERVRSDLVSRIRAVLPETVELRQDIWLHRACAPTCRSTVPADRVS